MATFIVTTDTDIVDVGDGVTSLREALIFANAFGGADSIVFDGSLSGATLRLALGEFEITDDVTISGDIDGDGGADITITGDVLGNDVTDVDGLTDVAASLASAAALGDGIDNDGDGAADGADGDGETLLDDNSRIFEITSDATAVTLDGLNVTGGRATDIVQHGGAIESGAALTVSNSRLSGNSIGEDGGAGGAVHALSATFIDSVISGNATASPSGDGGGVRTTGDLTLIGSQVTGNVTTGVGGKGGGVSAGGAVTAIDSEISDNATHGNTARGGGIDSVGDVTLVNAIVSGNSTAGEAARGGGIATSSDVTATDSVISGNSTAGQRAPGGGIDTSADVTLIGSEVSGNSTTGDNSAGGGVGVVGEATIISSRILDNSTAGDGAAGGGINAVRFLTMLDSTVAGNATTGDASHGGGIAVSGGATVTNSTIAWNSTAGDFSDGGGMDAAGGGATLTNVTVTGNSTSGAPSYGGGLHGSGMFYLANSIVAGNFALQNADDETTGPQTFSGGNLIGGALFTDASMIDNAITAAHVFETVAETQADLDGDGTPEYATGAFGGVLEDRGGPVPTIALRADAANPALDMGKAQFIDEISTGLDFNADGDQIDMLAFGADGAPRLFDQVSLGGFGGDVIDLGAVELNEPVSLIVDTVHDDPFTNGFVFSEDRDGTGLSLREALALAGDGETITFDPSLAGATLELTQGSLTIQGDVTIDGDIDGDGKADIEISGMGQDRAFLITGAGTEAALRSLELTGGHGLSNGGAIQVDAGASLALSHSTLHGNTASVSGGAIFSEGDVTIASSTLTGNWANGYGGALYNGGGAMTLVNVTIDGNTALDGGSGVETNGGTLDILSSTITSNTGGAGVSSEISGSDVTILNSVVALNTGDAGVENSLQLAGSNVTAGNSFFGNTETASIDTDLGGNFQGGDPRLDPLADNGGTVETRKIQSLSELINGGDAAHLPLDDLDIDGDGSRAEILPLGANGEVRVLRGAPDIGAHESDQRLVITDASGNGDGSVNGTAYDDHLLGLGGNDALFGEGGDDLLEGGSGADRLDGGLGSDTADYSNSSAGVIVNLNNANPGSGGHAAGDSLVSIENMLGSNFADDITGDANANRIEGNAGDDILNGYNGADTLLGGNGDDTLDGGALGDTLFGGDGADTLLGGLADDALSGDEGDDMLEGGAGADALDGGAGTDTARYGASAAGVDINLNDAFAESGGDAQGDTLAGIENLEGSAFADTLTGDAAANRIAGGGGGDVLNGFNGADTLLGGDGADILDGGALADLLFGGEGDDMLTGGAGEGDRMQGDAGRDLFILDSGDGRDTVVDFELGLDRVDLNAFSGVASIADIDMAATAGGANTALRFGADKLVLVDIALGDLTNADFVFA